MPFELIYTQDSDKTMRKKRLERDLEKTLQYVADVLRNNLLCCESLRQAIQKIGWR
jgi:hypothetical protein